MTVAKACWLLRAILNTAVRDKRIRENPCQIKGAYKESSPVRPVLTVPEVYRLADAIDPHYRALILLATFGKLRWGELAGLRRRNLDVAAPRTVGVAETVYELDRLVKGKPKSAASVRKVALPELIVPERVRHLDMFAGSGPDSFVFVGVKGGQLRRSNFSKLWARALAKAGLPTGTHVHDLRHTREHAQRGGRRFTPRVDEPHGSLFGSGRHGLSARETSATGSSPQIWTAWPGGS